MRLTMTKEPHPQAQSNCISHNILLYLNHPKLSIIAMVCVLFLASSSVTNILISIQSSKKLVAASPEYPDLDAAQHPVDKHLTLKV